MRRRGQWTQRRLHAVLAHARDQQRLTRFPDEIDQLERLGLENFETLARDLEELGIDAELERTGDLVVALEPHELPDLPEEAELMRRFGHEIELLDGEQVRGEITSRGALLATGAYPPLVGTIRRYIAPVYDYALVTEPLDERLRDAIGWRGRQGLSDMGNQFHYSRLTADGRILWGGYDAVYRYGGPVGPELDDHDPTFARLSQHLFTAFPQLDGVRFTHRWGGAIDTCSRFSVFFGRALGGRVSYALGYTGLGVAASRFGGRVALDLLDGRTSETTALAMVRRRPLPFPPEPARTAVIQLTRNRLAAADRQDGRRGVWLKTLDRLGLGFDS